MFTDHLDGSLTYNPANFALSDVSLRTITTSTDYDLTTLHLGPMPSGVPFDAYLNSGPFIQPVGPDVMLQFFQMDFTILTNFADTITLHLPDSVGSSVSAVPEPPSILLLANVSVITILSCIARRSLQRKRQVRQESPC